MRIRLWGRSAVVLASAVLLAGSATALSSAAVGAPGTGVLPATAPNPGEPKARDAVVNAATKAPTFAGAWIQPDGAVHLRFVDDEIPGSVAAVARAGGVKLVASRAAFTESELESVREELLRDRAQLRRAGGNFVMSYVDPKLNAVVLTVEAPISVAFRARMVAQYGNRVQVQEGGASTAAGIPPLTNFNVKAGSYIDDGTWACSAAFNVDTSSNNTPTAKAYFFTAGHCFELQSQLENSGGTTVGTVAKRTYTNCQVCPADVEYVSEYYNYITGVFGLSTNQLTNGVRITSVGLGPYTVGASLCKVGNRSGTSCGTIQQTGLSICYEAGSCFTGMLKVSNDYCHGDSGGAVYAGGAASGIVSGRTWTTSSEPDCGGAMGLASTMAGVKSAGYTTNLEVTN